MDGRTDHGESGVLQRGVQIGDEGPARRPEQHHEKGEARRTRHRHSHNPEDHRDRSEGDDRDHAHAWSQEVLPAHCAKCARERERMRESSGPNAEPVEEGGHDQSRAPHRHANAARHSKSTHRGSAGSVEAGWPAGYPTRVFPSQLWYSVA